MTGVTNITLDGIFTNPDVEVSASYDELIGDDPRIVGFWSANAGGLATQAIGGGTGVSMMPNRKAGSPLVLQQAAPGAMPFLLEGVGPQGRDVIELNNAGGDNMAASAPDALPLGDRCWVAVFRAPPATANTYIVWSGSATGGYFALLLATPDGGTRIIGRIGTAGALAEVTGNFVPNTWQVAILSYNAASKTLRLKMNAGAFAASPPADPVIDQTTLVIGGGALNALRMSDLIVGVCDLVEPDNAELTDDILGYVRDVLGLAA
ncbi:MAG: hypothetical protein ACT4OK_01105 [Gemmobacter sp.]